MHLGHTHDHVRSSDVNTHSRVRAVTVIPLFSLECSIRVTPRHVYTCVSMRKGCNGNLYYGTRSDELALNIVNNRLLAPKCLVIRKDRVFPFSTHMI